MSRIDQLIERYLADPGADALAVLTDAWLEAGDVRGAVAVAATRAEIAAALEAFVEPLAAELLGFEWLQVRSGFLVELSLPIDQIETFRFDALAGERLLTLAISGIGSEDRDGDERIEKARAALPRGLFGLALPTRFDQLIEAARPRLLRVTGDAPPRPWPWIEALSLQYGGTPASEWLEACDRVVALELDGNAPMPRSLSAHPSLVHLDIRGRALTAAERAAIDDWLAAGEGRTVRHPAYGLAPPAGFDWFSDTGHIWPLCDDEARGAMAIDGDLDYTIYSRDVVQIHAGDQPDTQIVEAVTAVARDGDLTVCGTDSGELWSFRGLRFETPFTAPGPILALDVRGDDRLVVWDGGWSALIGGVESGGEGPIGAGALSGDEPAIAVGSELRRGSERWDLGDDILAVAADGDHLVAIDATRVWLIDGGEPSLLGRRRPTTRPVVAIADDTVAWLSSPQVVEIRRGGVATQASYPTGYSGGSFSSVLRVADIACDRSGAVLAVFENGGANLLLAGRALKVDPFAGEPDGSWVFVYEGEILIA